MVAIGLTFKSEFLNGLKITHEFLSGLSDKTANYVWLAR